jgi:hypothetical protein
VYCRKTCRRHIRNYVPSSDPSRPFAVNSFLLFRSSILVVFRVSAPPWWAFGSPILAISNTRVAPLPSAVGILEFHSFLRVPEPALSEPVASRTGVLCGSGLSVFRSRRCRGSERTGRSLHPPPTPYVHPIPPKVTQIHPRISRGPITQSRAISPSCDPAHPTPPGSSHPIPRHPRLAWVSAIRPRLA